MLRTTGAGRGSLTRWGSISCGNSQTSSSSGVCRWAPALPAASLVCVTSPLPAGGHGAPEILHQASAAFCQLLLPGSLDRDGVPQDGLARQHQRQLLGVRVRDRAHPRLLILQRLHRYSSLRHCLSVSLYSVLCQLRCQRCLDSCVCLGRCLLRPSRGRQSEELPGGGARTLQVPRQEAVRLVPPVVSHAGQVTLHSYSGKIIFLYFVGLRIPADSTSNNISLC